MKSKIYLKGGEKMKNQEIRQKAKACGVNLWEIADAMNISEASMTRLMRKALSTEKADEINAIIETISEGR